MIGYLLGMAPLPARTASPRRITPMADAEKRPYNLTAMSASARYATLLAELDELGEATTNGLAEWLGTYPKNVARDLADLMAQDKIAFTESRRGAMVVRHWRIKESA